MNHLDVIITRLIYNKKRKIQPGSLPNCMKKYQSIFHNDYISSRSTKLSETQKIN